MNIFDRYIIKTVLLFTLLFFLIILSLYAFISLVDAFKYVGRGTFEISDAFYYTMLTMPRRMYELFPFSVLLGAMMGLGTLNSNNELIAIRTAGVSVASIIFSVMKAAFILAIFMFTVGEYIIPVTESMAANHWTHKTHGAVSINIKDSVWIRDKDSYTKIHTISADKSLGKVSIFSFNEDKTLKVSSEAQSAHFINEEWILKNIKQTLISEDKVTFNEIEQTQWPTLLDLELVDVIISNLENLSALGLFRYSTYLDTINLESNQYWLSFWSKIVAPFSIIAMLLMSIPFVFDTSRSNNTGSRLIFGVLIGIIFTITNKITAQFGLLYDISPFLSASLVTLVTIFIASILIKRMN